MIDQEQVLKYLKGNPRRHGRKYSNDDDKDTKQIRERRKFGIIANLGYSKYELVRRAVIDAGFSVKDEDDLSDAFLVWTDNFLPFERIMRLKPYQRINHFPGMVEICRKDFLAKNFIRMNRLEPTEYSFVPKTWVLPQEHGFLLNYIEKAVSQGEKPNFIMKPANGAMGHGIRMFRAGDSIPTVSLDGTPCVVQEYISNPLLIDGFKCDLRVYVLLTSCDPLRIFIYNEGLVRLGTEKYVPPSKPNGDSMYMHLTNYAVNKRNAGYDKSPGETDGSKRSFTFLDQYLRHTCRIDPSTVWRNIRDLIVKTMAIAAPHLLHSYRMCRHGRLPGQRACSVDRRLLQVNYGSPQLRWRKLNNGHLKTKSAKPPKSPEGNRDKSTAFIQSNFFEILGFDILLDSEFKPWLIEVNRSPSFNGDQELDRKVKRGLLKDTFRLLNIRPVDKENSEKEQRQHVFRRLYKNSSSVSFSLCNSFVDGTQSIRKPRDSSKSERDFLSPKNQKLNQEFDRLCVQLLGARRRLAQEFFEYHNCGDWCLIFPTDDPVSQKRFASFILTNFEMFYNGKLGDLQRELEDTYLKPVTEDEILDKLNELKRRKDFVHLDFSIDPNEWDTFQVDDYQVTSSDESSDGWGSCSNLTLTTTTSVSRAADLAERSTSSSGCCMLATRKTLAGNSVQHFDPTHR
ncbi:Tubulin polyglutamylase ttll7 [Clonorchis sinensis]|uniref:Tubulin polyglutamylase ttll7 n=1 Tax=Clonorchis sinensis TaxID=79923 RepID=A0A8T1MZY4_CLOSI|nr:Tubulin polyglutamylase ttll7 [Clonorchis sinensis]